MKKKMKKLLERCVVFAIVVALTITTYGGYYNVHAEDSHNGHGEWTDLSTVSGGGGYEHEITSSGNYYLSSNVEVSENTPFLHISGEINVTICLNGKDISTNYNDIITIDGNASVTITNCHNDESKICATTAVGKFIHQIGGTLTLEKVTLEEKQGENYTYPLVCVNGDGNLTVNNVKFDSQGYCIRLMETGNIYISNSTFTVSSSLDGGGKIIYTDYNYTIGDIIVTDSIFNWNKGNGISITSQDLGSVNISESTFNCAGGISVKGGEVNVSNCVFEGTDEESLGSAIYMTSVADKNNKLTVSGGKYNTRNSGINVDSRNAAVDVTLKGNIEFNHTAEYGDLTLFPMFEPFKSQVNLHLDELTTQNLNMYVPSTEYEGAITCDSDYSAKLKARDTKYAVHCEEADGKYVVKFNERKITTQPTVDSAKVEVSDNTGVSFQWYKAGEKAYELNAAGIDGVLVPNDNYHYYVGSYENGVWKPEEFEEGMYGVMFEIEDFKGNCTIVFENKKGSLEECKENFGVRDLENNDSFESEVKDGKLYFSGKADGLSIWGIVPQDAELIVKLIVPNDTEALQGQNTNTLTAAQPGDYRCHATWDAGTDYSYEILSDTLTINQAIGSDVDIKLNKLSATLSVGEELTLNVTTVDGTAVSGATWSSSNKNVATVENGVVKAVASGTADITATVNGKTATCTVTVKDVVHTHTIVTDAAVAPTCTETGKTEGKHCSVCGEVITAQTTVAALGHDWSNDWVVTKPATTITEGKKECTCKRAGCNQKKYEVIPVIGTPVDPNEGKLDKDAEVAPNAPIEEATIDNTKTELLNAPSIFTEAERQAIESGADARVWMEVSRTDESSIPSADKTKISDAATSIMGENHSITYFDADLFKQVGDGAATQLHEPGIEVEVTIKVPETLLNGDNNFEREYKIIRLHTDVATGASLVDILSGTFDKITGEFTFKTDKFSTYAIAYTDKKLVTGVTLTPATATLTQAGQAVQLTATVAPADATDKSVTWSSSNTNVATVDANGKVTAVANGTAVITVTTTDGSKTAQSTITVAIATTQAPSDNTTPSSSASIKKAVSNRIRLNGGMKFSKTGKQLNLAWGKVSGADGYDVYVQYCGKLFNAKSVTTIKNAKTNKIVIKKINGKSIDPKKVYKAYVVAYKMSKGKKVTLAKSITVHVVGSKHATETNVKSIKLSKDSYTLKKGKTVQIKAKSVLVDSKKKRISDNHGKEFRYTTSNVKVATVTKDGKIKAVGTGTCTIYVYAVNGYAKKITVTVK